MLDKEIISQAQEVLQTEGESILRLIPRLGKNFIQAIELLYQCKGRVIIIGMGKPGIIAKKISATLASTGTPSFFLHPAEAAHGDLGMVTERDIVVILSNSGETEEIIKILPSIKRIGSKIVALTGKVNSTLARNSDVVLDTSVEKEACKLGLAPTSSTTAMLAMGDALAVVLFQKKGFRKEDYAFFHPGGILGKRLLLRVKDIMRTGKANPLVRENEIVRNVLLRITQARAGAAVVVDAYGKLVGIFTDGDLRRHLEKDVHLLKRKVSEVMSRKPVVVDKERLVVECVKIFEEKKIDEIPVVDENNIVIGLLDVQDVLKSGVV
ncbi:MAG: KpsF/GutQ family sugar-phosphate isomerase [Candidatus Omnitrophota bacterium]|nr:MAG: KpsF/GutQ family sugar-phosphate isomerase [Candidatus Omnitrophota bacterium]